MPDQPSQASLEDAEQEHGCFAANTEDMVMRSYFEWLQQNNPTGLQQEFEANPELVTKHIKQK